MIRCATMIDEQRRTTSSVSMVDVDLRLCGCGCRRGTSIEVIGVLSVVVVGRAMIAKSTPASASSTAARLVGFFLSLAVGSRDGMRQVGII